MRLTRQAIINIVLAVVIVAALVVVAIVLWPKGQATSSAASRLTSTVQQGTVSSTISASGSISPVRESDPSFKVSGTVNTVYVSLGDTVKKGQKLAKLSTSSYQQAVDDAYTSYVHAEQNLTATKSQKGAQVSQVNSAKEQVTQAWEQYQSAKTDLSHTTLTAPIAGIVTAVNVAKGDSAGGTGGASSSSSGAFTIADVSKYVMTANIAEADIAQVTVGQDATITFPALDDATATAKVTAIAPTATSSNSVVTYATTITLTSTPDNLRLGQTADAAIVISSSAADALYVPAAAITTTSDGTKTVEVVGADGTEQAVTVQTGVVGDNGTEITSGLTAGETIVIGTLSTTTGTGTTGTTGRNGGFGGFGGTGGFPGGGTGGFPGGGQVINRGGNN